MATDTHDYLRFDVGSIDDLIKQKLSTDFPDVNQRGSSANILSEAISSVFTLLLYQLNRSSANSSFAKTNSVESLISITKQLGYNPVGHQAQSMFVDISTLRTLDNISYTIPRYSFIKTPNGNFSLTEDLTFTNEFDHEYTPFRNEILKGGIYVEHPLLLSNGGKNQVYTISRGSNIIDHNSIDIYVRKPGKNDWEMYERCDSLFLASSNDKFFECRYNQQGSYDITFGDGINGYSPLVDSEIAIYYLAINNNTSTIETGSIESEPFNRLLTSRFNDIMDDISSSNESLFLIDLKNTFGATNTSPTTLKSDPETVDEIRRNAPSNFKSQNRLITREDYRSYVLNNFSDFVSDVLVLSNEEYLNSYIKYYSELGLSKPFEESRALFNQINYSSAVNFNNVYIFMLSDSAGYLTDIQKRMIVDSIGKTKTLSAEIIPSDGIVINFGIATPINSVLFEDLDSSGLLIEKSPNVNISENDLKRSVVDTITKYFSEKSKFFNQTIDVSEITSKILSIDGVRGISTTNGTSTSSGLGLYEWNAAYPEKVNSAPPTNKFTGIFVPKFLENDLFNKIEFI